MTVHKLAGKPAPHEKLTNVPRLVSAYYTIPPIQKTHTSALALAPPVTGAHRPEIASTKITS